jgi:hypothetical protein
MLQVKATIMSDDGMMIFEGIFSILASIFLTYLGIGFLRFADLERKWSQKVCLSRSLAFPLDLDL